MCSTFVHIYIVFMDTLYVRVFFAMQVVERFTGNYVFALGISRFLSCAHWVFQVGAIVVGCLLSFMGV